MSSLLLLQQDLARHIAVSHAMEALLPEIEKVAQLCIDALKSGRKILLCGNGGSAADAQHIAAELVGRFQTEREGLSAIALTTDTSILTAVGNDYGYARIFSRQIEALAREGDVLLAYSTSGNSENIILATEVAQKLGCHVVGMLGKDGGKLGQLCDHALIIPAPDTAHIQEMHLMVGHMLCHLIDVAYL